MPLTRCQNLAIGLGAVVLLTLTGIAAAFLTSNPSGAQRVPALDGVALEGWRNDEVALAWEQPGNVEPRYFFLNVRTGERTPLPTLPPLPQDKKPRGDSSRESYARSFPKLSPDGQWLLYKETRSWSWMDSAGNLGYRWRLVRLTDGTSRLWPSDGSFQRSPHPELDNHNDFTQHTLWLPDSQGWAELEEFQSGPCSLTSYPVSSLAPRPLPPPTPLPNSRFQELLPTGQGLFTPRASNPGRIALQLLPLAPGSPPEERLSLPIPGGAANYGFVDADSTRLLVMVDTEVQGLSRWLATVRQLGVPQISALWRVPRSGARPQCLLKFGREIGQLGFARDKKQLYYWPRRQRADEATRAYVVPL